MAFPDRKVRARTQTVLTVWLSCPLWPHGFQPFSSSWPQFLISSSGPRDVVSCLVTKVCASPQEVMLWRRIKIATQVPPTRGCRQQIQSAQPEPRAAQTSFLCDASGATGEAELES